MRRPILGTLCLAATLVLTGIGPAGAQSPGRTVSDRPAATLLLPYFEVDLDDPAGLTTRFTVNNASATAVLAHVTVWSDLAVPVLSFDVYLTGYDVQPIDLRAVLSGQLPQTASAGQDPTDAISPKGPLSQDINFASCNGLLPPAPLDAATVAHLRAALTGQFSPLLGGCCGRSFGDSHARGYVTIDTVSQCSAAHPGDPGYFIAGGLGIASNQNVLWGDVAHVARGKRPAARGGPLVHIQASSTDPETSVPGQYTFYGRYVGWTAADNRQPLGASFVARYINTEPFEAGTSFLVWRDPKVAQGAFACGGTPAWFPLEQVGLTIFDEQEHPQINPGVPIFPQPPHPQSTPFPGATQVVKVGGADLPVTFDSGWIFLNLNTAVAAAGANPPENPLVAQSWVEVAHDPEGRLSVGYRATMFADAATIGSGFGGVGFVPGGF